MKLYEVQSGDINGKFRAPDPETAFLKAVRRVQHVKGKPVPVPGMILRVREVTEEFKPIPHKDDPDGWVYYSPLDLIKRL
jgi:hypothetical protein